MFTFGFNVKPRKAGGVSYDADAAAFFTAASITDTTQKSAVNQLVLDLKSYNIWTKMKAIYPVVGGSAGSHAVNLKTPGTFNLTFATGWTHASTGMTPNGTSAYADTFLSPSTQLTLNNTHISYYSRTNILESSNSEMGSYSGTGGNAFYMVFGRTGNIAYSFQYDQYTSSNFVTATGQSDSRGLWLSNRTSNVATTHKLWRNGISLGNATTTAGTFLSNNIWIGAINNSLGGSPPAYYSKKQCAFASIGDGLTDTEAANFYTAVQAYQTTLGRSIGTQTVSDSDAQTFINSASITDQVEANAINDLVIGLKADSLWTKMKAIYPIVGGSAGSHAVNLKTPGTYNLTFATGMTHSSTGMTGNGSTGYANTSLTPSSHLTNNNTHISYYSRTDINGTYFDIGLGYAGGQYMDLALRLTGSIYSDQYNNTTNRITTTNANSLGFYISSRTTSTVFKLFKNNAQIGTTNTSASSGFASLVNPIIINALLDNNVANYFSPRQCAFASIGDGLTDAEAANFYTRVQNFQTTLNRQV